MSLYAQAVIPAVLACIHACACVLIPHPCLERARCINGSAASKRPMAHIRTEPKLDVATTIMNDLISASCLSYIIVLIYSTCSVCMLHIDKHTPNHIDYINIYGNHLAFLTIQILNKWSLLLTKYLSTITTSPMKTFYFIAAVL